MNRLTTITDIAASILFLGTGIYHAFFNDNEPFLLGALFVFVSGLLLDRALNHE